MSFTRRAWTVSIALLFLSPAVTFADDKADKTPKFDWDAERTTSPESVEELKALQAKVKEVYKKATACTVGLLLGSETESRGGLSCGSGVIVNADGLVLTAAHVISKPREKFEIVLFNGQRVRGETLGLNTTNDSGMARITDKPPKDFPGAKDGKWPFMEVGTSAELKKGQWIVSMGHPGGPKPERPPPVRTGRFVSLEKAGRFQRNDLLNTDGTLVGGDSGGPLFDLTGRVVGIHSEIGDTLDQNRHVPTEKFKSEWDRMARGDLILRTAAEVRRNTKVTMNAKLDDKATDGAKIEVINANGMAEMAGLEAGDVIVSFNGNKVKSTDDLRQMLPSYKVGEKVKLEVDRGGHVMTVEIKLVEKPRD